jgi:ankyrin repeat protein
MLAVYQEDTDYLASNVVSMNKSFPDGTNPLLAASKALCLKSIAILLHGGAKANCVGSDGGNCCKLRRVREANVSVHLVAHNAPSSIEEQDRVLRALGMLLTAGCNVNARDSVGNTPLHLVCSISCNHAMVSMLVQGGADVSISDYYGCLPLMAVARFVPFQKGVTHSCSSNLTQRSFPTSSSVPTS